MPLKPIAKFWKKTSSKGSTYYQFSLRDPLSAGAKVMLFRRDNANDGSAGNVCLAIDDAQCKAESRSLASRGGQYRSPPTDGSNDDPGGFMQEMAELAGGQPAVDVPF